MDLTEDDVLEILKLVEQSKFDFFQLEQGELKLTIARNGYVPPTEGTVAPPRAAASQAVPGPAARPAPSPAASPAAAEVEAEAEDGLITVVAPMVGTFYAAPSPEDPPYVEKGARVAAGTTLGLIESMKVFTAIKADVGGTVEVILVVNAQFVEYGQALFRIRPDAAEGRS